MSNRRKRTRQISACRQSTGQTSSAIHCPATSSMTTNCGSLRPLSRAAMVAAGTPMAMEIAIPARSAMNSDLWRRMNTPRERGPQQNRSHRSPCAGTGLAISGAEERGDSKSPRGFVWHRGRGRDVSLHRSHRRFSPVRPRPAPPRSSSTSGSRTGELIL